MFKLSRKNSCNYHVIKVIRLLNFSDYFCRNINILVSITSINSINLIEDLYVTYLQKGKILIAQTFSEVVKILG